MRAIAAVVLTACGASAHPAPALPPPLPADPAAARTEIALRFVRALAARDRAAMDAVVDVPGFCAAMPKPVDHCADAMAKADQAAYDAYLQGVPAGAAPGAVDEFVIDASQGIYQENVHVPGAGEGLIAVIEIELGGRPYVVFPVKKGE